MNFDFVNSGLVFTLIGLGVAVILWLYNESK
jgi:hypothetical protein